MKRWQRTACGAAMVAALVVGTGTGTAVAEDGPARGAFTFAVIGDIPYGAAQIARFPKVVDHINADPAPSSR